MSKVIVLTIIDIDSLKVVNDLASLSIWLSMPIRWIAESCEMLVALTSLT